MGPKPDKFNIFFEELDKVLVNTVFPNCFRCRHSLPVGTCVTVGVPERAYLRFHQECFMNFVQGLVAFQVYIKHMRVQSTNLQ